MAYGARLESVLGASPRGFESPILRRYRIARFHAGDSGLSVLGASSQVRGGSNPPFSAVFIFSQAPVSSQVHAARSGAADVSLRSTDAVAMPGAATGILSR